MTTLYRHTYRIGTAFDATVTIDEDSPIPAPIGTDWDASIDHVRVAATLILPTDIGGRILADLLGSRIYVAGVLLTSEWGERCPVGRQRVIRLGAETLAEAVGSVRHKIECDIAEIRGHVALREARLGLREARLARGRAALPPRQELVARFDVTGLPSGEISALAAEVAAQGEASEEHPDVAVRVEMGSAIPMHCVDPTEAPTARIRVPAPEGELSDEEFVLSKTGAIPAAIPDEFDDWGQPVTPRSGPPE